MQSYQPLRESFGGHGEDHDGDDYSPQGDGRDGKGRSEKSDKERKGAINRVNRACNNCRRMKMRCVGAEDPPCKRCRNGGLDCIMEKPGRSGGDSIGEDRIRTLETQVTSIQNTLSDLVSTLRSNMIPQVPPSNGSNHSTTPDYNAALSHLQGGSAPSPRGHPSFHPVTALASQPRFSQSIGQSPNSLARSTATYNPYATGALAHDESPTGQTPRSGDATRSSPFPLNSDNSGFRRPALPGSSNSAVWHPFPSPGTDPSLSQRHMSLPPSRAGSEGADDILAPEDIVNPLGTMSNMAGLVEAAIKRSHEERGHTSPVAQKRTSASDPDGETRGGKRRRVSENPPPAVVEAQGLPQTQTLAPPKAKSKVKKTHVHAYPDCVDEGIVSEEIGRELFATYYDGANNFIPCYDPAFDTWESLKVRSPFTITTIVMVGARVRDRGNEPSLVQRKCREHAQRIASGTMFNPVARVEAVQAMSILAAFSDNGWLPGGHAVRMALDMGINKSFIRLLRTGMGKNKTPEELEEERPLVVHSRTWFCLYLMEHQMAYGMGRPAILREDETIHQCRRLLEHPLAITSDARLISTVELTALRAPLHIELTASPDLPIDHNALKRLKQANNEFDSWERYWDRVLSDRFGKGKGDFFRESLKIQRQYAELFVNSQLLRGIREPADVKSLSEEKRALALRAMKNAQNCIDICIRGENYRHGLSYAVHYTHVCAAFAASFLIRIARLFPQELNLKKTAKDVEELAGVLSDVPAGRYARSLRLILRRARRAKVIPAASGPGSPTKGHPNLTMTSTQPHALQSVPALSPASLMNNGYAAGTSPNNLLFTAASQILDDSPQSVPGISDWDGTFAQENLERSGLQLGEGENLPLFLDGQALGGFPGMDSTGGFFALEPYFLPADVDNRLEGVATQLPGELAELFW